MTIGREASWAIGRGRTPWRVGVDFAAGLAAAAGSSLGASGSSARSSIANGSEVVTAFWAPVRPSSISRSKSKSVSAPARGGSFGSETRT